MEVFDWILRGIGLAVVAIIAWAFLGALWKGVRQSVSLHLTMLRGMRLNGRSPRWLRLPRSFFKHAFDLGTSTAHTDITGDGWSWSTDGTRRTWITPPLTANEVADG